MNVPSIWKRLTARIPWRKSLRPRNAVLLLAIILIIGLIITLFGDAIIELFQAPDPSAARILVLEDSDPDYRNPPFNDRVISFSPRGQTIPKLTGLNICETIGGARMLATSPDGEFFLVCENVSHHLIACRTQTGARLWTLAGDFAAASVAPDGTTYAVIGSGTIYGTRTLVIDRQGKIIKDDKVGGTDIALDPEHSVLWLVGATIKKCDLDLNVLRESQRLPWCAVSVDVTPDGSIWAAERQHSQVAQSSNRVLRISASLGTEKAVDLNFSPLCLRIDHSDGSVWVTGGFSRTPFTARLLESIEKTTGRLPIGKKLRNFLTHSRASSRTCKFDAEGELLVKIDHGGHTLDIDPVDGSVWIAGSNKIFHHSRIGKKISQFSATSGNQKYVVVATARKP